jgi:hypothetical protein
MEIPKGNTWKMAENRTLKWSSSPPRAVLSSLGGCSRSPEAVTNGRLKGTHVVNILPTGLIAGAAGSKFQPGRCAGSKRELKRGDGLSKQNSGSRPSRIVDGSLLLLLISHD